MRIYNRALSVSEIQQLYSGVTNSAVTLALNPPSVTLNEGETVRVYATFDSGCAGCPNVSDVQHSIGTELINLSVADASSIMVEPFSIPYRYYFEITGISPGSATFSLTYSPTMNGVTLGTATVGIPITVTGGNSGGGTGCASFNLFTSTLHIPCFNPGSPPTYWIDLMLHASNGIAFSLANFGENTTSIANNNATFNLFNGNLHVPCLDFGALPTYWLDLGLSTQGGQLLFNLDNFGQN